MKYRLITSIITISLLLTMFPSTTVRAEDFNKNFLIDDSLFIDTDSMTANDIQDWLDDNGGTLLQNWVDSVDMRRPSDNCVVHKATGMTAAEVIYEAATAWNAQIVENCAGTNVSYWGDADYSNYTMPTVNPRVLLVLLQKEQSLISANGTYSSSPADYKNPICCSSIEYKLARATGYGVPDNGSINEQYLGFYNQINWASWQLRYNFERSAGNTDWDEVGYKIFTGPFIEGNWKRCASCDPEEFDGYYTIDGSPLYMGNQATASLYYYTPHTYPGFYGNYNFVNFYSQWFGSVLTGQIGSLLWMEQQGFNKCPIEGDNATDRFGKVAYYKGDDGDNPWLALNSGGVTKCVEFMKWQNNLNALVEHRAGNTIEQDYATREIVYGDVNGNGKDSPFLIKYGSTATNKLEIHRWTRFYGGWELHAVTQVDEKSKDDVKVVFADTDGDGKDEAHMIKLNNTGSGNIGFLTWNNSYTAWKSARISHYPQVNKDRANVVFADNNGDGKDEAFLVVYNGTKSGKIAIHGWNKTYTQWVSHYKTSSNSAVTTRVEVVVGDVDNDGRDDWHKVVYNGTESGKIAIHRWTRNFKGWTLHKRTDQPEINVPSI